VKPFEGVGDGTPFPALRREEIEMIETDSAASPDVASAGAPEVATAPGSAGDMAAAAQAQAQPQGASVAPVPAAQQAARSGRGDWAWGAIVVIAGLVAIVAVFIFAVLQYKTAAEVTTAIGAVSGVIAALIGAYFGIRGASLAQVNSESNGGTPPKTKT
jgi:hypothetical protein